MIKLNIDCIIFVKQQLFIRPDDRKKNHYLQTTPQFEILLRMPCLLLCTMQFKNECYLTRYE